MRPPIQSEKHIVQVTPTTVAASAIGKILVLEAKQLADVTTAPADVRAGAIVKAVYLEFWATSDDATQSSLIWCVYKKPTGAGNMTFAQLNALNAFDGKQNVLLTGQGLVAPNTQLPTPIFRGWVKIPKGKQRMGLGDQLNVNVAGIANGGTFCGLAIYKAYF